MNSLVHIVDDDAAIRDSLQCLLNSVGLSVACYATAKAFLEAPASAQPGCILLDLRLPDLSGLEVQKRYVKRGFKRPIIFLTGHGDVEVTVQAMQQGAAEFLVKPVNEEKLLQKVREAIELDRRRQSEFRWKAMLRARIDLLSPRERDVMTGIVGGYSNKEVARQLYISPKTVELHRSNVMAKMRARSLAELVRMVVQAESEVKGPDRSQSDIASGEADMLSNDR